MQQDHWTGDQDNVEAFNLKICINCFCHYTSVFLWFFVDLAERKTVQIKCRRFQRTNNSQTMTPKTSRLFSPLFFFCCCPFDFM